MSGTRGSALPRVPTGSRIDIVFESGTNRTDLVVSNGVVRLAKLSFDDPDAEESPLAVASIHVDQIQMNLQERSIRVGAVDVVGARIFARLNQAGELNLASLFRAVGEDSAQSNPSDAREIAVAEVWTVDVEKVRLGAGMTFEDLSRATAFRTVLSPVEMDVDGFTTRVDSAGAFHFNLESEAAETVTGSGEFSVSPPRSSGEVQLSGFELKKYAPYFEGIFRGRIDSGRMSLGVPYRVALTAGELQAGVSNLVLKVDDLAVLAPDAAEPAVTVPSFAIEDVEASLAERRVRVGRVHTENGLIGIHRAKDGRLNLAELVIVPAGDGDGEESAGADGENPWVVDVEEIKLDGDGVKVKDEALPAFAHLGVASGRFDLEGKSRLHAAEAGPKFEFLGGLKLREVATTDLTVLEPLVEWDELTVAGMRVAGGPTGFAADEVSWRGLAGHVVIDAEGRLNLAGLAKPADANGAVTEPPQTVPATAESKPVSIEVGIFSLEDAALTFVDRSIAPAASFGIREVSGTIRGISSAPDTLAEVDLRAKIDGQSLVTVQGRMNPLAKDQMLDLTITNRDLQLSMFSPYMEKYAGYPLNRGRLSARLSYRVQQEQLSAENRFEIEQLTLGPRNNSPDATSLPVKLGIALLKDAEGRIELNVPLAGRLDDPTFRVAPLIGKVVVNMIAKAATSPFSLLGALVGGGEELSFVEFHPGGTHVIEGELDKLDKLAKAPDQRPALNVDLEGGVDPNQDGPPLRLAKLREQIRAHRLKELEVRGDSMALAPGFVIDPIDYERLLRTRFHQEIGDAASVEDLEGNHPSNAIQVLESPSEAEPKRGWFRRS